MPDDNHQEWHWGEGTKYALEGMKTLLLLNGGSAVALLAFVGNLKRSDATPGATATPLPTVGCAILCFGFGALCVAVAFSFAYVAQLMYGNKRVDHALIFHYLTYGTIVLSVLAFVAGLGFGWRGLQI
jgi:hypothetical protein